MTAPESSVNTPFTDPVDGAWANTKCAAHMMPKMKTPTLRKNVITPPTAYASVSWLVLGTFVTAESLQLPCLFIALRRLRRPDSNSPADHGQHSALPSESVLPLPEA